MAIYKTHLHSSLLAPEQAGVSPLPLELSRGVLYANEPGPLITVEQHWPSDSRPNVQSYYAASRPEANEIATLTKYGIHILSGGRLDFSAAETMAGYSKIAAVRFTPHGQDNLLLSARPVPKQKLPLGANIIMAADAPIEKLPAEAAVELVGQSLDADHPDFSRAVALSMMKNQPDIGRIFVAVVDVPPRRWRHDLARMARRAGAVAAAAATLKVLRESGPYTLAAVAAIAAAGVGAAAVTAFARLGPAGAIRSNNTARRSENRTALTSPTVQIPLQRRQAQETAQDQPVAAV